MDARKIENPTAEWGKQKTNQFNKDAVRALDEYDDDLKAQTDNTFSNNAKTEFKHAISLPKAELIACANRYLKNTANTAQNKLAVDPLDLLANKVFINAQVAYRNWRGTQMSEGVDDEEELEGLYSWDQPAIHDESVGLSTYRVIFSIKRDGHDAKDPFVAYTTHKNIPLEDFQAADILEIVKGTDIDDEAIRRQDSDFNKGMVDTLVAGLDKDWGSTAHQTPSYKKGYFTQIGAEAQTGARYAFKTGRELVGFKTKDGKMHGYRFDINKFIPTKSKIYQNPKVVQKMVVDMLNSPFPAMHADLSIFHETNAIGKSDCSLNWTVHKVFQGYHTATHLTYISDTDGLYNLPDTLPGIKGKYSSKIDIENCRSSQFKIDARLFTKQNDMSMIRLHCRQTKQALGMLAHASYGSFGKREKTNINNCGYIYEYLPDYTVIANTIIKPYKDHLFNSTSYTIIHWNPYIRKKESGPSHTTESDDRLKTVENMMNRLQVRVEGLDSGYNQLLPLEQFRLQVKDKQELGYFIPGILELDYAKSAGYEEFRSLGGYLIKSLNFQTKLVLEHQRHKLELELLTHHILPHFQRNTRNVFGSLKELVLDTFAEKQGDKTKYIPVYPGFLGTLLEKIHQRPSSYHAEDLIPHIKQWTLDWNAFLDSRGIPILRRESNSSELKVLVAEIEDRNTVRRDLERKSKKGQSSHPSHPSHPGYANNPRALPRPQWKGVNKKTGGALQGREHAPSFSAADRHRDSMSDMGFDRTHDKYQNSQFKSTTTHSQHSLAESAEFIPTKMQAEIDTLKRTLNELTLRISLQ